MCPSAAAAPSPPAPSRWRPWCYPPRRPPPPPSRAWRLPDTRESAGPGLPAEMTSPPRRLDLLVARGLEVLVARRLHLIAAWRLDVVAARGLHVLASRGRPRITARGRVLA